MVSKSHEHGDKNLTMGCTNMRNYHEIEWLTNERVAMRQNEAEAYRLARLATAGREMGVLGPFLARVRMAFGGAIRVFSNPAPTMLVPSHAKVPKRTR